MPRKARGRNLSVKTKSAKRAAERRKPTWASHVNSQASQPASNDGPFVCGLCEKQFVEIEDISTHLDSGSCAVSVMATDSVKKEEELGREEQEGIKSEYGAFYSDEPGAEPLPTPDPTRTQMMDTEFHSWLSDGGEQNDIEAKAESELDGVEEAPSSRLDPPESEDDDDRLDETKWECAICGVLIAKAMNIFNRHIRLFHEMKSMKDYERLTSVEPTTPDNHEDGLNAVMEEEEEEEEEEVDDVGRTGDEKETRYFKSEPTCDISDMEMDLTLWSSPKLVPDCDLPEMDIKLKEEVADDLKVKEGQCLARVVEEPEDKSETKSAKLTIEDDLKWTDGIEYHCAHCKGVFKNLSVAKSHARSEHNMPATTGASNKKGEYYWEWWKCFLCLQGGCRPQKTDVRGHLRDRHRLALPAFEALGLLDEAAGQKSYPWTEGCVFKCKACPVVHNSLRRIQMHAGLEHVGGDFTRGQVKHTALKTAFWECGQCQSSVRRVKESIIAHLKLKHGLSLEEYSQQSSRPEEKAVQSSRDVSQNLGGLKKSSVEALKLKTKGTQNNRKSLTKCPWCDKVLNSRVFCKHRKRAHFWGKFRCRECNFAAKFAKDLVDHMKRDGHAEDPECPACKDQFPMEEIGPHYEVCVVRDLRKRAAQCTTCGKTFKRESHLEVHRKVHLREQGVSEEEAGTALYHFCDRCGKRFKGKHILKAHVERVHEKKKEKGSEAKCPICCQVFDTVGRLHVHKGLKHPKDDLNRCKVCGEECGWASVLERHMRKHEESLRLPCRFCPKKFMSRQGLEGHERKCHTGERPFQCSVCEKAFSSKSMLTAHQRYLAGHDDSEDKPFECSKCHVRLSQSSYLRIHERQVHGVKS